MILNCETDSLDEMPDIRKEVFEVWDIFRKDVERASMTNATITIYVPDDEKATGHRLGYSFSFEKQTDDQWHEKH
jgi:hypothetical protein